MVDNLDLFELRRQVYAEILNTIRTKPALTYEQVAGLYKVCRKTVCNIAKANSIHRRTGRKPKVVK
jgi:hypothetical protein